jgi:hypothetical protein
MRQWPKPAARSGACRHDQGDCRADGKGCGGAGELRAGAGKQSLHGKNDIDKKLPVLYHIVQKWRKAMKKLAGFVIFVIFLGGFVSSQDLPRVTIVNNTGYTVYYMYISQSATSSWEEDVLHDSVLPNGESYRVRLLYPLNVTNRYDIRLKDSDGDTYTKWNVLITPDSRIVFTLSDIDIRSSTQTQTQTSSDLPVVTIVNNTGYMVYWVYISQTATDKWEEDVMGDDVLPDGNSVRVKLLYPLNVVNRYDVRLKDSDGDTYTKWNVLITPDSRIVFTISDLDY